jgi:hypothetical protein
MAGNRNSTEALVSLVCNEVDESTGGVVDSLEGIVVTSLQDSAVCYIRATNENFRWDQDSLAVPSASVILPFGQDLSVPGRWILITGGGGGGITTITGSGGISITNPGGPSTDVNGTALYARDATNGAMLANMSMGGFSITNAIGLSSAAALAIAATGNLTLSGNGGTALRWPAADGTVGQALVTNGAGVLSFATVGGGGTPAAPFNSVQYNNAGSFGGSAQHLFAIAAGGTGPQDLMTASDPADEDTGYVLRDSTTAEVGHFLYRNVEAATVELFGTDLLRVYGGTNFTLRVGGVEWEWPVADGTNGQALVTDGAGALSFATVSGGGTPTMQSITAAGPTNVTDTAYTIALVNFAGAAAVVLPPVSAGKVAVVKDASGNAAANNITITPASGTIDGEASQIIATDYGSMTFVSNGTNWFIL